MDVDEVSTQSNESSPCKMQYKDMLQDDPFLPWTFCHDVHNEAPEVSIGNKQHSWVSFVPKTITVHPSASKKMVLMDLLSEDTVFIFFFVGDAVRCYSTLCCFVSGSK